MKHINISKRHMSQYWPSRFTSGESKFLNQLVVNTSCTGPNEKLNVNVRFLDHIFQGELGIMGDQGPRGKRVGNITETF